MSNYDFNLQHTNYNDNKYLNHDSSFTSEHNPSSKLQTNPNFYTNPHQIKNLNFPNPITKSTPSSNQFSYENNFPPEKNSENFQKKENSFTMNNKSQIEEYSTLSQDAGGNKLRMQLMEKDKIIIEYTKVFKEKERQLEQTKKINLSKDELISNLKDENKKLKFKLKNSEIILQNKNEELEKFRSYAEEKIFELNKEKSQLEEKIEGISKIYENNQVEYQNTLIEYKKMEKQLLKLNKNFYDKNEHIMNLEKYQEDLKKENKNNPLMKKQISDMEKIISDMKLEFEKELYKREKVKKEKDDIEIALKRQLEENKIEKETNVKLLKMTFDIENLKKEIEEKSKESEKLTEKNKLTLKENDNFVKLYTNELSELTNILESFGNFKNSIDVNQIAKSFPKKEKNLFSGVKNLNTSYISQLNFKYELINKNFEILKNKIFENFLEFSNFSTKKEKKENELESQIKELTNDRTNLMKEIALNKQFIGEMSERNSYMEDNYEKLCSDFKSLKEKFVKTKIDAEQEKVSNENISKEVQLFLSTCFEKLKEKFPDADAELDLKNPSEENRAKTNANNNTSNHTYSGKSPYHIPLDYTNKLLFLIENLKRENMQLSTTEKELYETLNYNTSEIKKLQDEREALLFKLDRVFLAKEEDDKNSEWMKNEELKRQREVLYQKISSLTSLLEESNGMISLYEGENKELKEKVCKLEFNLKMLTRSHVELENSITGNATLLQGEFDDVENKYNQALREIEVKNFHVESVENILKRKEEEIACVNEMLFIYKNNHPSQRHDTENKFVEGDDERKEKSIFGENAKENNMNENISHYNKNYEDETSLRENKNYLSESGNRFMINEEKERELQKLINNYNLEKSENSNQKNDSFSSKMSGKKIPGKIYSIKNI